MADSKGTTKKRQLKKQPTVRERAEKAGGDKPRRIKQARTAVAKPLKSVVRFGRKQYFLPLPDNKVGRFLNKPRKAMPTYFRDAWKEVKLVIWPNRKETLKLTIAVFLFAFFFAALIGFVDLGLDKLFKQLILK